MGSITYIYIFHDGDFLIFSFFLSRLCLFGFLSFFYYSPYVSMDGILENRKRCHDVKT